LDVESDCGEDASLGVAAFWMDHRAVETTLTWDKFLVIPVVVYEAEDVGPDAIFSKGVQGPSTMDGVVGLLKIKEHLEEGLPLHVRQLLVELCLNDCRTGAALLAEAMKNVVEFYMSL
jgi:hypothetical protein